MASSLRQRRVASAKGAALINVARRRRNISTASHPIHRRRHRQQTGSRGSDDGGYGVARVSQEFHG